MHQTGQCDPEIQARPDKGKEMARVGEHEHAMLRPLQGHF